MRRSLFSILAACLAACLLAPVALAGRIPQCEDDRVRVEVGTTVTIECFTTFSGMTYPPYGDPVPFVFRSSNKSVATVTGRMNGEIGSRTKVRITGVAPGRATVRATTENGSSLGQYVQVEVEDGVSRTFELVAPESVRFGDRAIVTAQWSLPTEASYAWYVGRIGDTSRQLPDAGPTITYAPDKAGRQFVWVAATVNGVTHTAEIAIDVGQPKRRAVS